MYNGEKEERRSGRKNALHGMVAAFDSAMPSGNDLAFLTDCPLVGRDGLEQHGCVFNVNGEMAYKDSQDEGI